MLHQLRLKSHIDHIYAAACLQLFGCGVCADSPCMYASAAEVEAAGIDWDGQLDGC